MVTPYEDIFSCSGQNVMLNCKVPQGTQLNWNINYKDPSLSTLRLTLFNSDILNHTYTANDNHLLRFSLISTSPLTSIITTTMIPLLDEAIISCDSVSDSVQRVIHLITDGKLYNIIILLYLFITFIATRLFVYNNIIMLLRGMRGDVEMYILYSSSFLYRPHQLDVIILNLCHTAWKQLNTGNNGTIDSHSSRSKEIMA